MEINEYKQELLQREGLPLTKQIVLFTDFELYNQETDESIIFKTFDDVLKYKIDDKAIEDIIKEKIDIFQDDMGGRGAGTRATVKGGKLFGRKGGTGNLADEGKMNIIPPAVINTLTSSRFKSVEETAKAYGKNFLNADREYAGLIDANGFTLKHIKGKKTSVYHIEAEGQYTIHNHPSKVLNARAKGKVKYLNAPSTPDLRNWALGKGKGTIITASGNRTAYIIQKSNNFSGKAFVKEMGKATSTGNYDRDVANWLRRNQKKLNYKYSSIKF